MMQDTRSKGRDASVDLRAIHFAISAFTEEHHLCRIKIYSKDAFRRNAICVRSWLKDPCISVQSVRFYYVLLLHLFIYF